jgi:hypothetical protein
MMEHLLDYRLEHLGFFRLEEVSIAFQFHDMD